MLKKQLPYYTKNIFIFICKCAFRYFYFRKVFKLSLCINIQFERCAYIPYSERKLCKNFLNEINYLEYVEFF